MQEQCKTLRSGRRRLRGDGGACAARSGHGNCSSSRAADVILTGHDHDLFIDYDGRTAIVESSHDGLVVTVIDLTIQLDTREGRRITWFPNIRPIDTADIEPDPEVLARGARLRE